MKAIILQEKDLNLLLEKLQLTKFLNNSGRSHYTADSQGMLKKFTNGSITLFRNGFKSNLIKGSFNA